MKKVIHLWGAAEPEYINYQALKEVLHEIQSLSADSGVSNLVHTVIHHRLIELLKDESVDRYVVKPADL